MFIFFTYKSYLAQLYPGSMRCKFENEAVWIALIVASVKSHSLIHFSLFTSKFDSPRSPPLPLHILLHPPTDFYLIRISNCSQFYPCVLDRFISEQHTRLTQSMGFGESIPERTFLDSRGALGRLFLFGDPPPPSGRSFTGCWLITSTPRWTR